LKSEYVFAAISTKQANRHPSCLTLVDNFNPAQTPSTPHVSPHGPGAHSPLTLKNPLWSFYSKQAAKKN
jgi:hypothetical protein